MLFCDNQAMTNRDCPVSTLLSREPHCLTEQSKFYCKNFLHLFYLAIQPISFHFTFSFSVFILPIHFFPFLFQLLSHLLSASFLEILALLAWLQFDYFISFFIEIVLIFRQTRFRPLFIFVTLRVPNKLLWIIIMKKSLDDNFTSCLSQTS